MELEVADNIRLDFGYFIEHNHGALSLFFGLTIPQSLLPYPRESIEEALDIVTKHFSSINNYEAVKSIENIKSYLLWYVDDEIAVQKAIDKFTNGNFLEYLRFVSRKKDTFQRRLLNELESNPMDQLLQMAEMKVALTRLRVKTK